MKYSPRDLFELLQTPLGRSQIGYGLLYRAFPIAAAAARVQRRRRARSTRFVAVVGSFGKSTTARAVRAALGQDPRAHVEANSWTHIARRILAVRASDRHAVIEAGIAGPGEMARYATLIRPDVAVVTTIGSEHNRSLGSLDVTRDEKANMVRALPPGGTAVLNGDDPNVLWMRTQTRARVVTYGLGAGNDVAGSAVRLDWPHGIVLDVTTAGATRTVRAPLLGAKMAYPLLAALAVGTVEGRDPDEVVRALAGVPPPPARLEPVALPGDVWLIRDEFKSALETVHAAFDLLAAIPARRKIVVLGDVAEPVGKQGPIYLDLGARLAGVADLTVVVGKHRKSVAAGLERAGGDRASVIDVKHSVFAAIDLLRRELRPGDVVLVKGRDTERLDRVALALEGREVRCELRVCTVKNRCGRCPMLATGWHGRRVVT